MAALEFSRDRKMMSVLCRQGAGCTLFCKGAPEALLLRCSQVCPMALCMALEFGDSRSLQGCTLFCKGAPEGPSAAVLPGLPLWPQAGV